MSDIGLELVCEAVTLSWPFFVNTVFLLIISSISIMGNTFVFFILHQSRSLHFNVRLLLKNFILCAGFLSIYTIGRCVYNFHVWFNGFIIVTHYICGVVETQMLIIVISMILSIAGVGVDRVVNTIWKNEHQDADKPSVAAYFTLTLCWLGGLAAGTPLIAMGYPARSNSAPMCYCEGVHAAAHLFTYVICPSFVLLEAATVVCYLFLYKHSRSTYMNFTINTTQHSLAKRYQMLSNVRTTVLLMPTIVVHGTTYFILAALACYLGISRIEQKDTAPSMIYMLMMVDIPILEAATHPFLLLARHEYLLKTATRYLPILSRFASEGKSNGPATGPTAARIDPGGMRKRGLSILPIPSRIENGVVEYRIKPEEHEDILNVIWLTKNRGSARHNVN